MINGNTVYPNNDNDNGVVNVRGIEFEIIYHRTTKPKNEYPTKSQVYEVLSNGKDSTHNSLVVTFEGYPKLVPLYNIVPATITGYPIRLETLGAGNGYFGQQVSDSSVENFHYIILEAWLDHLETGKEFYRDYAVGGQSKEEIIRKIEQELEKIS
ncbi:hypothetical protein CVD28_07630 [Bacillus sp. M6-12]|uniref:hypothetical protein n=1 Tax=Bacillus sp. M6-12 TaxID=2054166 RepID=UPI000C756C19|nr:hypothetical protein [Bacillus sp. M6-12]PLS18155.1 hypothetical protein CVD28_07630 [Bacillus sp. M6-12]